MPKANSCRSTCQALRIAVRSWVVVTIARTTVTKPKFAMSAASAAGSETNRSSPVEASAAGPIALNTSAATSAVRPKLPTLNRIRSNCLLRNCGR